MIPLTSKMAPAFSPPLKFEKPGIKQKMNFSRDYCNGICMNTLTIHPSFALVGAFGLFGFILL